MADAALLPLVPYGLLLGWSVAWPPGPINAEIVRRGLTSGFWPAYGVGLGASTGDAIWAVAVVLGAGALLGSAVSGSALSALSTALLLALAVVYLRGAWHGLATWRRGATATPPGRLAGARAGYLLGLGLALSSPWNIAFWLAVIGRAETQQAGPAGSLVVACAVLLGTNFWVLLLCSGVVVLRLRFAGGAWEAAAKGTTGLLMLAFAADGIKRLAVMLPY
ncbi:MAG TPA: LysE family transporter [Stellaceae bacterium]|nr:LysE family transporter [Stellaceae bacterium]